MAPSVGGNLFGSITGEELVLGLSSDALTKMTVHALCSVIRVAKKGGVFGFLTVSIDNLLGGEDDAQADAQAILERILEHAPSINRKCYVSRLIFLARLSAIYRMETDFLKVKNADNFVKFEPPLMEAVISSLNILNNACGEIVTKDEQTTKRKRDATSTSDDTIGTQLKTI